MKVYIHKQAKDFLFLFIFKKKKKKVNILESFIGMILSSTRLYSCS